MLVLDPSKRLSVAQIKEHKWMALDVPVQRPVLYQQPLSAEGEASVGEYSEQVLRLMHSLGIDQHKTIEVRSGLQRGNGFIYLTAVNRCEVQQDKLQTLKITLKVNFEYAFYICSRCAFIQHDKGECPTV